MFSHGGRLSANYLNVHNIRHMSIKMNIMRYFLKDNKECHVRQLAKLEKKSPTTISKYLESYKKEGLLVSSRRFNHLFYKANMDNPAFRDMKIAYNIEQIRSSGLIEFLEKGCPEAIILFGSMRKGDNAEKSDIDIAVIEPEKEEPDVAPYEKKLNHGIQLIQLTPKDIESLKANNKEFLNSIANGIVLYGFLELFR